MTTINTHLDPIYLGIQRGLGRVHAAAATLAGADMLNGEATAKNSINALFDGGRKTEDESVAVVRRPSSVETLGRFLPRCTSACA